MPCSDPQYHSLRCSDPHAFAFTAAGFNSPMSDALKRVAQLWYQNLTIQTRRAPFHSSALSLALTVYCLACNVW